MKIRVLQGFRGYEAGQTFEDWPDGMCEILIQKGMIERIDEPTVERSVEDVEVERAEASPRVSKKPQRK